MTIWDSPSDTARDRAELSDAKYASLILFAASLGAVSDFATGHAAVFNSLLTGDDDDASKLHLGLSLERTQPGSADDRVASEDVAVTR